MPEVKNAVRMNISLPADLKEQMDDFGNAVNWSQVAAQAFRATVAEYRARADDASLVDVIQRLRVAGEREDNEDFGYGEDAGNGWARRHATPRELRRLERAVGDSGSADAFVSSRGETVSIGDFIASVVYGDDYEYECAWGLKVFGHENHDMIENEATARGFIEGALDVWAAVKSQV